MHTRSLLFAALTLMSVLGPTVVAEGAAIPAVWCGADETSVDRADRVLGNQVHVVYARAADRPSRFFEYVPLIARDLAGLDEWWREQDPARVPRFDLASLAPCDTQFGTLDVSSIALAPDADSSTVEGAIAAVPAALAGAQLDSTAKKYLVYLDAPRPPSLCGMARPSSSAGRAIAPAIVFVEGGAGCTMDELGNGDGRPAMIAAHELLHALNAGRLGGPHSCEGASLEAGTAGHVCGEEGDVLGASHPTRLDDAVLDVGRDDYYGHAGTWWDVQDSAWLAHLELAPVDVTIVVSTTTGGTVRLTEDISCESNCTWNVDGGTTLQLVPSGTDTARFKRWTGGGPCTGQPADCSLTLAEPTTVRAVFEPAYKVNASVLGGGAIEAKAVGTCLAYCAWSMPATRNSSISARADRGFTFVRWRGGCHGTDNPCVLHPRANTEPGELTAVFRRSS